MERKTKEFVCNCCDDVIVVPEGDVGQCDKCGKEFVYHYESMETMYKDLLAYRHLANKNWSNLTDVNIKINLIVQDVLQNKSFQEIKEKILKLKEMSMQFTMTGMNELQHFYGEFGCEDCE